MCKLWLHNAFININITFSVVPLRNCKELLDAGFSKSGLYVIQPGGQGGEFVVFCDMTLRGGGWTIIQRRLNNNLSFYKNYASYQNGFGDFAENFWLGLDKINRLTDSSNELYIGLEAHFGHSTFSLYNDFSVGNEASGYRLTVRGFDKVPSTAGDSMAFHNNMKFSTPDRDQDGSKDESCAETFRGGWWYNNCHKSNLNGKYYGGLERYYHVPDGLSWSSWVGNKHSLKSTLIAIRPKI